MALAVWIVTKHEEFARAASRQLASHDYTVRTSSQEQALEGVGSEGFRPVVVLADHDAKTADGHPLHEALRTTLPGCPIVLLCSLAQASTAAGLARSGDVWDYLPTDSVQDPNRIPLLVERARANVSKDRDDTELQYRRVLQTLRELRDILKGEGNNPITEVLDRFKVSGSSDLADSAVLGDLADGYERCLVELICGRLRRLENEMLLLARGETSVAAESHDHRILVVEDDEVSGDMAKNILQKSGFDVIVANTALVAKRALGENTPALVLMDVHLGDANGLELIKLMRAGSTCPNVPVIVVTADRMRDTLVHAAGVNIQGYLLKPYEPKVLVGKVKEVLERTKAEALAGA